MAEYIDREAFKKSVEEYYCKPCKAEGKDYNGCRCRACWVDDMLDDIDCFQPAADVAPVRHGRWIIDSAGGKIACSDCRCIYLGYNGGLPPNYCPNCGANAAARVKKPRAPKMTCDEMLQNLKSIAKEGDRQ